MLSSSSTSQKLLHQIDVMLTFMKKDLSQDSLAQAVSQSAAIALSSSAEALSSADFVSPQTGTQLEDSEKLKILRERVIAISQSNECFKLSSSLFTEAAAAEAPSPISAEDQEMQLQTTEIELVEIIHRQNRLLMENIATLYKDNQQQLEILASSLMIPEDEKCILLLSKADELERKMIEAGQHVRTHDAAASMKKLLEIQVELKAFPRKLLTLSHRCNLFYKTRTQLQQWASAILRPLFEMLVSKDLNGSKVSQALINAFGASEIADLETAFVSCHELVIKHLTERAKEQSETACKMQPSVKIIESSSAAAATSSSDSSCSSFSDLQLNSENIIFPLMGEQGTIKLLKMPPPQALKFSYNKASDSITISLTEKINMEGAIYVPIYYGFVNFTLVATGMEFAMDKEQLIAKPIYDLVLPWGMGMIATPIIKQFLSKSIPISIPNPNLFRQFSLNEIFEF